MKRITAPQDPRAATRAKVATAAAKAAERRPGVTRTDAERDQLLDLLLQRVAELEG